MKALVFDDHGGPEVVQLREVADPEPGHGQVRVRVAACGVNHLDIWVRAGMPGVGPMPHILGSEVAGTVERLGSGVEGLNVGETVVVLPGRGCGHCEFCRAGREQVCPRYRVLGNQRQGGYAEFVVVDADDCYVVREDQWSLVEWAAVPLVFQTAWHMLFDRAGLRPGDRVLVESGGSGVGTAALQIAKLAGASVAATAGGESKRRRLVALGVDLAIDHSLGQVRTAVREWTGGRGVDIVVAHVGGETFNESLASLARGGRLITCGATAGPKVQLDLRFLFTREQTISGAYLGTRSDLESVVQLVGQGKLKPIVDRVFPFEEYGQAMMRLTEREVFGKVVLTP